MDGNIMKRSIEIPLRSLFATSGWGGRKYLMFAFTERGDAILLLAV
jgi:hypothetical protein